MMLLENPSAMPRWDGVDHVEEPYVKARIVAPAEYIGAIMQLGTDRRGVYKNMHYVDATRVEFDWEFPLAEIILDFYDKLKTISRGYASLDYEMLDYRLSDLVKLDMLINGDAVDAFSVIIHRDKAYEWGRKIADKLRELIPRQLFEVAIQAAIGQKVIARTSVKPVRKDVLAKCYGGTITRKRKLWEAEGRKRRMKQVGSVEIPQEGSRRIAGRLMALPAPAEPLSGADRGARQQDRSTSTPSHPDGVHCGHHPTTPLIAELATRGPVDIVTTPVSATLLRTIRRCAAFSGSTSETRRAESAGCGDGADDSAVREQHAAGVDRPLPTSPRARRAAPCWPSSRAPTSASDLRRPCSLMYTTRVALHRESPSRGAPVAPRLSG